MQDQAKRIAIIVDRHDSALGTSAHNRARLDSSIEVVAAMDFRSPRKFLESLARQPFDLLFFTWRFVAWELMASKKRSSRLDSLPGSPLISVLIPDHLGLLAATGSKEAELLHAIDYFLVTNKTLATHYSVSYPSKFRGIFHDLPADEVIKGLRQNHFDIESRQGLVWIGNSRWGQNLGLRDHKGFLKVVKMIATHLNDVSFTFFDSARFRTPLESVLLKLSNSRYLIQASMNEGTGLPLLEAMGTGTIPITTDVGVAKEVLPTKLQFLIVERDPKDFINCYMRLENMDLSSISDALRVAYDEHTERVKLEQLYFSADRGTRMICTSLIVQMIIHAKWFWRYLKYIKK